MRKPFSFAMRASVPEQVLMRDLSGEAVLLNLDTECYFGLDATGTRMWTAFTSSESIQAAHQELLAEFDVDTELLRRDMQELLDKLLDQGLVEIGNG